MFFSRCFSIWLTFVMHLWSRFSYCKWAHYKFLTIYDMIRCTVSLTLLVVALCVAVRTQYVCACVSIYLCRGGIVCGLSCRWRQLHPVATVTAVDRVHRDHCRLTRVESRARTPTRCTGNARPRMRDVTSPRRRNMADVIGKSPLSCSAKYT